MKKGDIVICIDDDSTDEDFGLSGMVFYGRNDLTVGKEYEIEEIGRRHIPKQTRPSMMADHPDQKIWTDEEYKGVRFAWTKFKLKGIKDQVFGSCLKLKL